MKVLLVNGSPHEHGCTYTALNEIAMTLQKSGIETEILYLGKQALHGCIACGNCYRTGQCAFSDLVNETANRIQEFDGLIVGTPVHYASPSAQVIAFLDRLFYSASGKMAGKLGASIVSCRRGGATSSFDCLNKYFTIANMPIVSSQYWNMVHGNTPDEVMKDAEGLQTMRTLGQNMAWLLKCIEAGKKQGIEKPVYEEHVFTNFI